MFSFLITVGAGVISSLIASYIYDKIKRNGK